MIYNLRAKFTNFCNSLNLFIYNLYLVNTIKPYMVYNNYSYIYHEYIRESLIIEGSVLGTCSRCTIN